MVTFGVFHAAALGADATVVANGDNVATTRSALRRARRTRRRVRSEDEVGRSAIGCDRAVEPPVGAAVDSERGRPAAIPVADDGEVGRLTEHDGVVGIAGRDMVAQEEDPTAPDAG